MPLSLHGFPAPSRRRFPALPCEVFAGYPMQTVIRFSRFNWCLAGSLSHFQKNFLGPDRSGFEGENRTWEVRFLWTALDRAYHKIARFFRKWYFRFLPSKPEVIVPVWRNIEWINADFHRTNFSPRKFAYSVSAETCSQRNFVRNIGFGRSPTSVLKLDL